MKPMARGVVREGEVLIEVDTTNAGGPSLVA
jgi:hypothetical protein